jgi:hypothetical protein
MAVEKAIFSGLLDIFYPQFLLILKEGDFFENSHA